MCRFVSVGPRLSSFLIDLTEDDLNMADTSTLLPIRSDQTLQICGYPLHDVYQNLLDKLPPQVVFNEYGVQVRDILFWFDHFINIFFLKTWLNIGFKFLSHTILCCARYKFLWNTFDTLICSANILHNKGHLLRYLHAFHAVKCSQFLYSCQFHLF